LGYLLTLSFLFYILIIFPWTISVIIFLIGTVLAVRTQLLRTHTSCLGQKFRSWKCSANSHVGSQRIWNMKLFFWYIRSPYLRVSELSVVVQTLLLLLFAINLLPFVTFPWCGKNLFVILCKTWCFKADY
jgi:hypothetical protein